MIFFNKISALPFAGKGKVFPKTYEKQVTTVLLNLLVPITPHQEGIFRVAGNRKTVTAQSELIQSIVAFFTEFITTPDSLPFTSLTERATLLSEQLKQHYENDEGEKTHNRILIIKAIFSQLAPLLLTPKQGKFTPDLSDASLAQLSGKQRFILSTLIQFLRYISTYAQYNLMDSRNLAKIFSGTLQGPNQALSEKSMKSSLKLAAQSQQTALRLEEQLTQLITCESPAFSHCHQFDFDFEYTQSQPSASATDSADEDELSVSPRPILFRLPVRSHDLQKLYGRASTWV